MDVTEYEPLLDTVHQRLARTDPQLARRWRQLARAPRYRLLLNPDERFACVLILLPAKKPDTGATPEERLLRVIFAQSDSTVLAVERGSRRLYDLGANDRKGRERLLRAARRGEATALHVWSNWAARSGGRLGRNSLELLTRGACLSLLAGSHLHQAEELLQQALDQYPALRDALPGSVGKIRTALKAREMSHIREARALLFEHLDRRALRHTRGLSLDQYHWLNSADPTLRRRREQALAAYPLLVSGLIDGRDRAVEELTPVIDAGRELVPALAEQFAVGRAVIRRLRRVRPAAFTGMTKERLRLALRLLAWLPPAWWPKTTIEWRLFRQAVAEVGAFLGLLRWHGASETAVQEANQSFMSSLARHGWERGWQRWRRGFHWTQELRDAQDLWTALRHSQGIDDRDEPEQAEVRRLLAPLAERIARGGIAYLRDCSEVWHAALHQYDSAGLQAGTEGRLTWPAITSAFAWRGWVVEAIDNSDRLGEAAHELRNCAAGHVSQCLFSATHLLTIGRGGRIASLAEVRLERRPEDQDGPWRLDLRQHQGRFNKEPPPEARQALAAWQRAVATGELAVDFPALEAARAERCAQRERIDQRLEEATLARERYALRRAGLIADPPLPP